METTTDQLIADIEADIAARGENRAPIPLSMSFEHNEATGKWEWLVILDVHIHRVRYLSIDTVATTLNEALATTRRRLAREYPLR